MIKADIVSKISSDTRIQKPIVETVVEAFFDSIIDSVAEGNKVTFAGFGSFEPVERKGRQARNPQNDEPVMIPTYIAPRFKPGKKFKSAVYKVVK